MSNSAQNHRPCFCIAVLLFGAISVAGATGQTVALKVESLRCEGRSDPQAVDTERPMLSWLILAENSADPPRGVVQTAWQVLAANSPDALARNEANLWDSGRVESKNSIQNPYGGTPPPFSGDCWWKVRVWAKDVTGAETVTPWSRPAFWRRGVSPDLKSKGWIRLEPPPADADVLSAWAVRREFILEKEISRAVAYYSSTGFCELFINGERIGDGAGMPAIADFYSRMYHLSEEITRRVAPGKNTIGLALGPGWLAHGQEPAAWLLLFVDHPDGSRTSIATDKSWRGAYLPSLAWRGHSMGAGITETSWARVGFDDSGWSQVVEIPPLGGILAAQTILPARSSGEKPAVSATEIAPGHWRFDFGQILQGRPRIIGSSPSPPGLLCIPQLHGSPSTGIGHSWRSRGEPEVAFEPRFAISRFDSVEVHGLASGPAQAVAVKISDDIKISSSFNCSNSSIVAEFNARREALAAGCFGVPSELDDGPLPRGRLAGRASRIAGDLLLFDCAPLAKKWFADLLDSQRPNGSFPEWAPPRDNPDEADWRSSLSVVTVPLALYAITGDRRALESAVPAINMFLGWSKDKLEAEFEEGDLSGRVALDLTKLALDLSQRGVEPSEDGEASLAAANLFDPVLGSAPGASHIMRIGGLRPDPLHPGFKRALIMPEFADGMEFASTAFLSPHGWFRCSWNRHSEGTTKTIKMHIEIPPNSSAVAALPFNPEQLTEKGQPIAEATGIKLQNSQATRSIFLIGSGIYTISASTLPPPATP